MFVLFAILALVAGQTCDEASCDITNKPSFSDCPVGPVVSCVVNTDPQPDSACRWSSLPCPGQQGDACDGISGVTCAEPLECTLSDPNDPNSGICTAGTPPEGQEGDACGGTTGVTCAQPLVCGSSSVCTAASTSADGQKGDACGGTTGVTCAQPLECTLGDPNDPNSGLCTEVVVTPPSDRAEGQACGGQEAATCKTGLDCKLQDANDPESGICIDPTLRKLGESCDTSHLCDAGLDCIVTAPATTGTCQPQPLAGLGQACDATQPCDTGLYCDNHASTDGKGVCKALVTCDTDTAVCSNGTTVTRDPTFGCQFHCDVKVCRGQAQKICKITGAKVTRDPKTCTFPTCPKPQYAKLGQRCGPDFRQCDPTLALTCLINPKQKDGTCRRDYAKQGQRCGGWTNRLCNPGLYCFLNNDQPTSIGHCQPPAKQGQRCGRGRPCTNLNTLHCLPLHPNTASTLGVCRQKLATKGQKCSAQVPCATGLKCQLNKCQPIYQQLGQACGGKAVNPKVCAPGLICKIRNVVGATNGVCRRP